MVAVFASVACLAYAISLALQRIVPAIAPALAIALDGGVKPTYYLRTGLSLALGGITGLLARGLKGPERTLAWATGLVLVLSVGLICVFV